MTTIYPAPDSEEFLNDIAKAEELMKDMRSIDDYNKAAAIVTTVACYAEALLSTDTSSKLFLEAGGKADLLSAEWEKASTEFLRSFDPEGLPEEYSYFSEILKVEKSHMMSPAEEDLAASLSLCGASSWERLQMTLSSSIGIGGRTLTELRSLAYAEDRSVREKAFRDEKRILKEHSASIAASLSGVKGWALELERRRGWEDPLDRALFSSRMSRASLDALMASIKDSLPVFRRYLAWKARYLGLEKLSFYDIFAPAGKSGSYSYEEAKEIVVSAYGSFSEDMAAFARKAYAANWVDVPPCQGKTGGAYDTFFPLRGESRIFMNFDGTFNSVSTLAHETGHAYHDSVIKDLPPTLAEYPMTLAESASTFGERLVHEYMLQRVSGDEKLFIIEQFVSSVCQVIVDIYSRFLFERAAFDLRRSGDFLPSDLSALMLQAQKDSYGELGEYHEYMWAVKSHYYSADLSFYNYPYAFGQLFALALASKRSEPGFDRKYRELLSLTGRMSAEDVALSVGCDITDKAFWDSGMKLVEADIQRLEEWS